MYLSIHWCTGELWDADFRFISLGICLELTPQPRVYHRGMVAMTPVPQITAFILAGGKSTRMGTDKAFVKFNGKTLLLRALEIARGVTGDVRIVGSPEKFSKYGPVVEDIFRDCGPGPGYCGAAGVL